MVATSRQRPDAARRVEPLLMPLSLLTLVTGLEDAARYLGLGRVFTANMTGNVSLLVAVIIGRGSPIEPGASARPAGGSIFRLTGILD
jgi:Protein of unknown function (DUF1275)